MKRTGWRSHNASNGKDFGMKEGDILLERFDTNTTETVLLFTNKGNYIYLPVYEMPDIRWKDLGQHVANIVSLDGMKPSFGQLSYRTLRKKSDLSYL